jgi:hypothetical protein
MSQLWTHSDEDIEKWAVDPNCIEREQCAAFLVERRALEEKRQAQEVEARATKRAELQDNPFDPRSEVSADAKHVAGRIVTHLWIIFVLLPVVLAVLWSLMK